MSDELLLLFVKGGGNQKETIFTTQQFINETRQYSIRVRDLAVFQCRIYDLHLIYLLTADTLLLLPAKSVVRIHFH
jgi:hypothetical protein